MILLSFYLEKLKPDTEKTKKKSNFISIPLAKVGSLSYCIKISRTGVPSPRCADCTGHWTTSKVAPGDTDF